jgi:Tfp pilus assembly protein PilF
MLEETLELHKAGRLEDAEGRYRELLAFDPDNAEVLHLLGTLRRQRGDVVEAIALVTRATVLAPERANFQTTLGGLYMHVREWARSRQAFARAVELNPNLTSAYSALAQIAMLLREHDEAEKHFKLALRAGEERVEVLTGYGNLLLARAKPEAAIQYLTRAVELFPQVASAQGSLGRAYLNAGHFAFSERALSNALALDPQYHAGRLLLAEAQFKQKRYDLARESLAPLLEVARYRGDALAMRGDIARAQDRFDEAIADYR